MKDKVWRASLTSSLFFVCSARNRRLKAQARPTITGDEERSVKGKPIVVAILVSIFVDNDRDNDGRRQ